MTFQSPFEMKLYIASMILRLRETFWRC